MSTNYKLQTTNPRRGAVLLIAVLMASVMLSVGLGVYQRTYKQLVFSSFWKQMQVSFAAADSGLECAMYWDLHPGTPSCFGAAYSTWTVQNWTPGITSGNFEVNTSGGCVIVTITKPSPNDMPAPAPAGTKYSTYIESRGYNDVCGSTNPRRVERALKIDY